MPERLPQLITRLKDEGAATAAFFRALPPSAWPQQVYTTGPEWDVRQVLCHFVSAETSLVALFKRILATGQGVPEDFDIDRWNKGHVARMDDMTSEQLIPDFERARAETVAWVETLSEADLDKVGRHPFLGDERLEAMLKLLYRHNMLHQRDVRKALETGQPVPPSD